MNLQTMHSLARIVTGLWRTAAVTLLLAMIVMRLAGVQLSVVQTASMSPTVPIDSLTMTRPVAATAIAVGDAIMFTDQAGAPVMHRVTEVLDHGGIRRFRTKGDANRTADRLLVHEKQVTGVLVGAVPRVGALARGHQSPLGGVALAAVFVPLFMWALRGRTPAVGGHAAARRSLMVLAPDGGVLCPSWLYS